MLTTALPLPGELEEAQSFEGAGVVDMIIVGEDGEEQEDLFVGCWLLDEETFQRGSCCK